MPDDRLWLFQEIAAKRKFELNTVPFLLDRYLGDDRRQVEEFEDVALNFGIAPAGVGEAGGDFGFGSCWLEEADSLGHSLLLLKRIADGLDARVEICLLPAMRLARFRAGLSQGDFGVGTGGPVPTLIFAKSWLVGGVFGFGVRVGFYAT